MYLLRGRLSAVSPATPEKFTYGTIGQICADSYNLFFTDAIAVISEACDNFMPPA